MNNAIDEVKEKLPEEELIIDVSDLFKVLGDPTRVKILTTLEIKELCVNEICECLDMTKSAVSHQLRVLRQSKLVKYRKVGKEVYYSLDDDHVVQIFDCALFHIRE